MTSLKGGESKKVSRQEQRRQQLARKKRVGALKLWGPVAALLIVLIGVAIIRITEPEVLGAMFVDGAPAGEHDLEAEIALGDLPPTGGLHSPQWQNCGIYDQPVNAANAVHALEHGAVWITYHPDLPSEQITQLRDLVRGSTHLLLSPYPGQASDVVLTAWDVQLSLETAADERVSEFIDRYRNTRGPEPGASCSNGIGSPIN